MLSAMNNRYRSLPHSPLLLLLLFISLLASCAQNRTVPSLAREDLFSLSYGRFDSQLDLFNLADSAISRTALVMQDGFFYIANTEADKVLQLNSYGDLLSIYYDPATTPEPAFIRQSRQGTSISTRRALTYPFSRIGGIAVDSEKRLYIADTLPPERQERDPQSGVLLSQVILRFASDGSFIDYVGQQGPGGTPFPFIKSLHVTEAGELVVVCASGAGCDVYWFSQSGYHLYTIPVSLDSLPNPFAEEGEGEYFISLDSVLPDETGRRLFFKIDYYTDSVDEASMVQDGVEYVSTLLYPFSVESGQYDTPILVPPLEKTQEDSSGKRYLQSYEFLGESASGWHFFLAEDTKGYMLQMIRADGKKILRRKITLGPNEQARYYSFALSKEGIISGLFANETEATVSWWRADELIDALVKQ